MCCRHGGTRPPRCRAPPPPERRSGNDPRLRPAVDQAAPALDPRARSRGTCLPRLSPARPPSGAAPVGAEGLTPPAGRPARCHLRTRVPSGTCHVLEPPPPALPAQLGLPGRPRAGAAPGPSRPGRPHVDGLRVGLGRERPRTRHRRKARAREASRGPPPRCLSQAKQQAVPVRPPDRRSGARVRVASSTQRHASRSDRGRDSGGRREICSAQPAWAAKQCAEPGKEWQRATPEEAGMDAAKLQEALDYGSSQA